MRLTARGWSRDMGATCIGEADLETDALVLAGVGAPPPNTRIDEVYVTISDAAHVHWGGRIALNGQYAFDLTLEKADIAHLFVKTFGDSLTPADLRALGIDVLQDDFPGRLASMTVADVFEEMRRATDPVLKRKIEDLEVSVRTSLSLRNAGINTIGQLIRMSEAAMLRVPNLGRKSLNELKKVLAELGLSFRTS